MRFLCVSYPLPFNTIWKIGGHTGLGSGFVTCLTLRRENLWKCLKSAGFWKYWYWGTDNIFPVLNISRADIIIPKGNQWLPGQINYRKPCHLHIFLKKLRRGCCFRTSDLRTRLMKTIVFSKLKSLQYFNHQKSNIYPCSTKSRMALRLYHITSNVITNELTRQGSKSDFNMKTPTSHLSVTSSISFIENATETRGKEPTHVHGMKVKMTSFSTCRTLPYTLHLSLCYIEFRVLSKMYAYKIGGGGL